MCHQFGEFRIVQVVVLQRSLIFPFPSKLTTSADLSNIRATRIIYNYLKGYEFDRVKAAYISDEEQGGNVGR